MAHTCLLEDLGAHLEIPALTQNLDLQFRYHNFTDADLTAVTPIILLRRSGTGGDDDDIAQQIDVDLTLLVAPDRIKVGEDIMHSLRLFLKSEEGMQGPGAYAYVVYSPIIGPVQLQNGRHRFMFMVRCFTEAQ